MIKEIPKEYTFSSHKSKIFNSVAAFIAVAVLLILFQPDIKISLVMVACAILITILQANYALSIIFTLIILVPSDYYSYMSLRSGVGSFPVYILLIAVFIIIELIRNSRIGISGKTSIGGFMMICGMALIFFGQIIAYINTDATTIIPNTVKFFIQSCGIFILVKTLELDDRDISRFFLYMLIIFSFSVVLGFLEMIGTLRISTIYGNVDSEWYNYAIKNSLGWKAQSTFGNSLVGGVTYCMCLPIIEYFRRTNRLNTVLQTVFLVILAVGIMQSSSRSSTIIIFLYFVYYLNKSHIKNRFIFTVFIIFGLAYVFSNMEFIALVNKFQVTTSDGSLEHRMSAFALFPSVFAKSPIFGVGLGNTYNVLSSYVGNTFHVNTFDNGFLDFSLASGIIGITGIIMVIIGLKKYDKGDREYLFTFTWVVFIIVSMFLNTTKYQTLWGMFWLYMSLCSWSTNIEKANM